MRWRVMIGLCILALLALTGVGVWHHFGAEAPTELDGAHTYVDNEKLLQSIAGTWTSVDERFALSIQEDGTVEIQWNGETVLEDTLQFNYLQPGNASDTEFDLSAWALTQNDGTAVGTVEALHYEAAGNGSIVMKLEDTNGKIETIVFWKNEI